MKCKIENSTCLTHKKPLVEIWGEEQCEEAFLEWAEAEGFLSQVDPEDDQQCLDGTFYVGAKH